MVQTKKRRRRTNKRQEQRTIKKVKRGRRRKTPEKVLVGGRIFNSLRRNTYSNATQIKQDKVNEFEKSKKLAKKKITSKSKSFEELTRMVHDLNDQLELIKSHYKIQIKPIKYTITINKENFLRVGSMNDQYMNIYVKKRKDVREKKEYTHSDLLVSFKILFPVINSMNGFE